MEARIEFYVRVYEERHQEAFRWLREMVAETGLSPAVIAVSLMNKAAREGWQPQDQQPTTGRQEQRAAPAAERPVQPAANGLHGGIASVSPSATPARVVAAVPTVPVAPFGSPMDEDTGQANGGLLGGLMDRGD